MAKPPQKRRFAQTEQVAPASYGETGYGALVLERMAKQVCRVAGVEWSCIFVRDRRDPRSVIAAAGHGVPWELIGSRIATDAGGLGRILATGEALVVDDYRELVPEAAVEGAAGASGAAVPIHWGGRVGGVLTAAGATSVQAFGDEELELLSELGELTAAALEHAEGRRRFDDLMHAHVAALAAAMDMRDRRTAQHSEDVVRLALAVGGLLGLGAASLLELEFAARLHDVGKIRVPDAVLHKAGPLDADEYDVIRNHSGWGAETLSSIPGLEAVAAVVRFHHERWDGAGYPDGLAGGRIPLASRIICACDAYAAMTADRPYRMAMDCAEALDEVCAGAGKQFDPAVVVALVEALRGSS
jgi:putative methionine-R-sulfoxide reductase with GAF domain